METTPSFHLEQDDDFVTIRADMPRARASKLDVEVVGDRAVLIKCAPYRLQVEFSGDVLEDERSSAKCDVDTGSLVVKLPKRVTGEHFRDLDLLTKAIVPKITPKGAATGRHLIEVVGEEEDEVEDHPPKSPEEPPKESKPARPRLEIGEEEGLRDLVVRVPGYGFNQSYRNYFERSSLRDEVGLVIRCRRVEDVGEDVRHEERKLAEEEAFDAERVIADTLGASEDAVFQEAVDFVGHWDEAFERREQKRNGELKEGERIVLHWTEEENHMLSRLPRREYRLSSTESHRVLCDIASILFATAYDARITGGDVSVESPWTIATLTPVLSFLCSFSSEHQTIQASARAVLAYPYLRSWQLVQLCLRDTTRILTLGRRAVLRTLLSTIKIMRSDEQRMHFNNIFLTDAAIWIQSVPHSLLESFAKSFTAKAIQFQPDDTGWPLEKILS